MSERSRSPRATGWPRESQSHAARLSILNLKRVFSNHIIHTVGPIYDDYRSEEEAAKLLRECYTKSLELAVEKELKSIVSDIFVLKVVI